MSKLKLHLQNIEGAEILTREQLKNVLGGGGDEPGSGNGAAAPGTCAWHMGTTAICGISKETAKEYVDYSGGNWCCDSCPSDLICY
jgi:hypothetical protein